MSDQCGSGRLPGCLHFIIATVPEWVPRDHCAKYFTDIVSLVLTTALCCEVQVPSALFGRGEVRTVWLREAAICPRTHNRLQFKYGKVYLQNMNSGPWRRTRPVLPQASLKSYLKMPFFSEFFGLGQKFFVSTLKFLFFFLVKPRFM